jgi:hypothetical protein
MVSDWNCLKYFCLFFTVLWSSGEQTFWSPCISAVNNAVYFVATGRTFTRDSNALHSEVGRNTIGVYMGVGQGRSKLFRAPRQWKNVRPLFQAVFLSQAESNTTPPSPKTEITNILVYILSFASIIKFKMQLFFNILPQQETKTAPSNPPP